MNKIHEKIICVDIEKFMYMVFIFDAVSQKMQK